MLVKAAPGQIDLNREELDTLLERELVALKQLAPGQPLPCITRNGDMVLRAAAQMA
jgi:hypothetical protein